MKYGKKYLDTLNSPGIPEEWRKQAIEYRQVSWRGTDALLTAIRQNALY